MAKKDCTSTGEGAEPLEASLADGGNARWRSHFGKRCASFLEGETCTYQMTQQFHASVFTPKKRKLSLYKNLLANVYGSLILSC